MRGQKEVLRVPGTEEGKWVEQSGSGGGEEARTNSHWKASGGFQAMIVFKYFRGNKKEQNGLRRLSVLNKVITFKLRLKD